MILFNTKRELNYFEMLEVLNLFENQKTTDKYTDTTIRICGDHATIDAEINSDGDILVL